MLFLSHPSPCRFADSLVRFVRLCRVQQSQVGSLSCCALRVTLRQVVCDPLSSLHRRETGQGPQSHGGFSASAARRRTPPHLRSEDSLQRTKLPTMSPYLIDSNCSFSGLGAAVGFRVHLCRITAGPAGLREGQVCTSWVQVT